MAAGVVEIVSLSWPFAVRHLEPVWARPGAYGQYVQVKHGELGFSTGYAHFSQLSVQDGQSVLAGEKLGESGDSGITFGAHVHVMVVRDGRPFDFQELLAAG